MALSITILGDNGWWDRFLYQWTRLTQVGLWISLNPTRPHSEQAICSTGFYGKTESRKKIEINSCKVDSVKYQSLSCVHRFVTPWTAACQAPLSMEVSRHKYWSRLLFSSPGDLPNQGSSSDQVSSSNQVSFIGGRFFFNHPSHQGSLQSWLQFSSVAQSCPTLYDPMNRSMPALPVHHQLPEFTQTHVHWVNDAIQPSHLLSSPSPPAPNPSQHQGL